MRKILSVIAAAAVCTALCSCSLPDIGTLFKGTDENNTDTTAEQSSDNAATESTQVSNDITIGIMDLDVFNPLITASPTVEDACSFIFESLYTVDSSYKPVPELAEKSELSEDGLTYTVTLKQGVSWHDGQGFSASNVVDTIRAIQSSGGNYSRYTESIVSARAIDYNVLEIKFSRPVAEPDALMVFPIVRYSINGSNENAFTVPIGTGPFKMVSDRKGDSYRLESFDGYHGGKSLIDAINIISVSDVDKFRTLFYANEIDMAATDVIDMSAYMPRANAKINDIVTNNMIYVGFNTQDQALSDSMTRRAISCMINRDDIVSHYIYGRAESADYALNPASWLYFDTRTHFKGDNSEAEILLEKAGWQHDTNDSLYNTFGGSMMLYFTPEILVNSESEERVKIAEDLCDKLDSFGIRANVEKVDYETYRSRISAGNYDIFIGETELLTNCDISDLVISSGNYFRFASPDIDLLLAQMGTVKTDDEKKNVAIKLFEKVREESPFAPICFRKESLITGSKIKESAAPGASEFINSTGTWRVN